MTTAEEKVLDALKGLLDEWTKDNSWNPAYDQMLESLNNGELGALIDVQNMAYALGDKLEEMMEE